MYRVGEVLYAIILTLTGIVSAVFVLPDLMEGDLIAYYTSFLIITSVLGLSLKGIGLSKSRYVLLHVWGLITAISVGIFPINYVFTVVTAIMSFRYLPTQVQVAYDRWVSIDVKKARELELSKNNADDFNFDVEEAEDKEIDIPDEFLEGYVGGVVKPTRSKIEFYGDVFNTMELTDEEMKILREDLDIEDDEEDVIEGFLEDGDVNPEYYNKYIKGEDVITLGDILGGGKDEDK